MTVTAEEIVECYGKHPVKDGIDQCSRRQDCPWGEACLSRSREKLDADHYHIANVSVGVMLYDPNEEDGSRQTFADEFSEVEAQAEHEMLSKTTESLDMDEIKEIKLEELTIPGAEYDSVIAVISKISELYFSAPASFEMLMKSIFQGKNQSEAAKEKGITRQGLNKRLLYELGIAQKRNDIQERRDRELAAAKQEYADKVEELRQKDEFFRTLSDRDWRIFKLVFADGMDYKSVAQQVNCSERTVYSVASFLRSKAGENCVILRGRKPKRK